MSNDDGDGHSVFGSLGEIAEGVGGVVDHGARALEDGLRGVGYDVESGYDHVAAGVDAATGDMSGASQHNADAKYEDHLSDWEYAQAERQITGHYTPPTDEVDDQ